MLGPHEELVRMLAGFSVRGTSLAASLANPHIATRINDTPGNANIFFAACVVQEYAVSGCSIKAALFKTNLEYLNSPLPKCVSMFDDV